MHAQTDHSPRFAQMTRRQKIVFVVKVAICILSFGLIYPNIMSD